MTVEILEHCSTCGDEDVVADAEYSAAGLSICADRCARYDPYPGLTVLPDTLTGNEPDATLQAAADTALADEEAGDFLRLMALYRREAHRDRKHGVFMSLDWQTHLVMRRALDAWRAEHAQTVLTDPAR